jgi:GT2 family glycosyltransferase
VFNRVAKQYLDKDVWLVFCHQDFILNEDLGLRLRDKDIEAVYGSIGAHSTYSKLFGRVIQTNGSPIGSELTGDHPVQTLDEMCLIVHSRAFQEKLFFDERFSFHFYGADYCMQAYISGFDVLALQLNCQHKSRTLRGDITSKEYVSSLNTFREKWKQFLPIRTTTKLIT